MTTLSVLIPGRNEIFMPNTVADVLKHSGPDTEVIAVLDGFEIDLPAHPRLRILRNKEAVGQRAATNQAARESTAKFVMKLDAHCAVDKGFDSKLIADLERHPDWTMIPQMRNLYVFDWMCKTCGNRNYMGPTPTKCEKFDKRGKKDETHNCPGTEFERVMVWRPRSGTRTDFWRFDHELHFDYRHGYTGAWEGKGENAGNITDTMTFIGACWITSRDRYWELGGLDEAHGSWGQMGTEIACKTWLSGGRLVCHKGTWFAHMFRTRQDFSFPYPMQHGAQEEARKYSRELWLNDAWPGQKLPLIWLIDKFAPLRGWDVKQEDGTVERHPSWHDDQCAEILRRVRESGRRFRPGVPPARREPSKGIIFYTDNELPERIAAPVREQLIRAAAEKHLPIVTAALRRRLTWGTKNIYFPSLKRGHAAMFKQILGALENSTADVVFFCEHDVLYSPSHFDFTPPDRTKVYYNLSLWQVRASDGHAIYWDAKRVSQLCGYRDVLIEHYRKRLERVEREGFTLAMGYEPGSHNRAERVDDLKSDTWRSPQPNVDIKHGGNLSRTKWSLADFRNAPTGWQEAERVPGWDALPVLATG